MSSAVNVFRILEEIVAHQEKGLSYSEVVEKTRLPKASVHRVLKLLVQTGYVRFDEEAGRYFGDLKLSFLGAEVTSHFDLQRYIRPRLLRLQAETRHTCNLGILSGRVGVYLDKIESPQVYGIKLFSEIGKRFPLHCTAMGKVLLASLESPERSSILAGKLEPYTLNTITHATKLSRELAQVRSAGYAVDREEITRGIMCVAAPVCDGQGQVVAAISTAFPAYINKDRGIGREIRAVTRCASEISTRLKGTDPEAKTRPVVRSMPAPRPKAGRTAGDEGTRREIVERRQER